MIRNKRLSLTQPCKRCGGTGREQDDRVIGAQWQAKRKEAGISLRALGARLKLSAAYLSDLECGRRRWSPTNVKRYTEAL